MLISLILFIAGMVAFTLSTASGGGGALLLLPLVATLVGTNATAPILNLGNFIGRPIRLVLFWKYIDWVVVRYYCPTAALGAFLGGLLISNIDLDWLQIIFGIFLISTFFQYNWGKRASSFPMPLWAFSIVGFVIAIISTLIGATGPVLNPFYLNYGLDKEHMVATKTANSFFVGIIQIGTYTFFGSLNSQMWTLGLALGGGIAVGNFLGKRLLQQISSQTFRRLVITVMVVSGVWLVVKVFMAPT